MGETMDKKSKLLFSFTGKKHQKEIEEHLEYYKQNPEEIFSQYLKKEDLRDVDTISPAWKLYEAKYHYNLVENGIIETLLNEKVNVEKADVFDIGSGAGHWIDFYKDTLCVNSVVGIDFVESIIKILCHKHRADKRVTIIRDDISKDGFVLENKFDIVNAIGVVFHIIDDNKWRIAVANIANHLKKNGIGIVGGVFGNKTATVPPDIKEKGPARRFRSRKMWKQLLIKNGCNIVEIKSLSWFKGWNGKSGIMDNLLIFKKQT